MTNPLFCIPELTIFKAQPNNRAKNSKKEMIVGGVASDLTRDVDEEILDPNGFEVDYLMQSGFVNWHHATQESPSTIIGEPLEAFTKNDKFFVKARLYDFQPLAHEVYAMASELAKNSSNRKLGWSIEGKKKEVNPLDKRFITKSRITGLAITPMPKNANTYLDIVKALKFEGEQLETIITEGIKREIILDITKGQKRIIVDRELNILTQDLGEEQKHLLILHKAIEANLLPLHIKTHIEKRFQRSF